MVVMIIVAMGIMMRSDKEAYGDSYGENMVKKVANGNHSNSCISDGSKNYK